MQKYYLLNYEKQIYLKKYYFKQKIIKKKIYIYLILEI